MTSDLPPLTSVRLRVLAIIPARGGSKGIPRKNIRLLGGKPLIQYTADAALAAQSLSRVVLSTDDEEIADAGRRCGLEVPFLRPPELARDDTPTLPVLQHLVHALENSGDSYEAICLLQPTCPFRRAADIDACVELMLRTGADSVVTVLPVPHIYNPHWVYFEDANGFLRLSTGELTPMPRRQLLPPAYHREGSVYITRRNVLMIENSIYGNNVAAHVMDPTQSVNLDTITDWQKAETLLGSPHPLPPKIRP